MLVRLFPACHAASHPPEKERRLVYDRFQNAWGRSSQIPGKENPDLPILDPSLNVSDGEVATITAHARTSTNEILHDVIFDNPAQRERAKLLLEGIAIAQPSQYKQMRTQGNEDVIERLLAQKNAKEAISRGPEYQLKALRYHYREDVKKILEHQAYDASPVVFCNAGEDFEKAYREKSHAKETPDTYPSAFQSGKELYFNPDHELFLKRVPDDAAHMTFTWRSDRDQCRRTAMHEVIHFELDKPKRGERYIAKAIKYLRELGMWDSLRSELTTIFGSATDSENDRWCVHEILAIYFGGRVIPYTGNSPSQMAHQKIFETIDAARKPNNHANLFDLLNEVETNVFDDYEETSRNLIAAVSERADMKNGQEKPMDELEGQTPTEVHTNSEQAKMQALQELENQDKELDEQHKEQVKSAGQIVSDIEAAKKKIAELRQYMQTANAVPPGQDARQYREAIRQNLEYASDLGNQLCVVGKWAGDLAKWEEPEKYGELPLKDKAKYANDWNYDNKQAYDALLKKNESSVIAELPTLDEASAEDHKRVRMEMEKALAGLKEPLETMEKIQDIRKDPVGSKHNVGFKNWLFDKLGYNGVEWLCVYDILKIFKIYKEAIVESYHAQQSISTSKIANQMSWIMDYIPYGKPVRQIIARQAKSANSEETGKYLEYLEKQGFTYDEIFKDGGVLDQNRNNKNRFKAVLQYSANHAWLYKMDRFNGYDVYGLDYINEFTKEDFRELVQKNEAGKKTETDRGFERIDKDADVPPIIKVLTEELKEKNIFAAQGILKRLQEKAKYAYSNTWGTTVILDALRRDKTLLDILDKGFLDQVGNIGISESAWTLTIFKIKRHEIMDWKEGKTDFTANGKNELTTVIQEIEGLLRASGDITDHTNPEERNKIVAKILAGHTFKGKTTISLFSSRFDYYRNFWLSTNSTTKSADTDDDWFNPQNGGSDVLLLNASSTMEIIRRESQGPFVERTKAPAFFAQVFMRDDELQAISPKDAGTNFRSEMQKKFDQYLDSLKGAGQDTFVTDMTQNYGGELAKINNKRIIAELIRRKMVSEKQVTHFLSTTSQNRIMDDVKTAYLETYGKHFSPPAAKK